MLWRSLKTGFFASILVMLAGCSGVSIGALDSRVEADISSVAVIDTGGRAGQLYNRELRRALYVNGEASPAYDLTSTISVSSSSTLSVRGVTSTFKKMTMTAVFTLKKQDDGEVLLSDQVTADATLGTVSSFVRSGSVGSACTRPHGKITGTACCATATTLFPEKFGRIRSVTANEDCATANCQLSC